MCWRDAVAVEAEDVFGFAIVGKGQYFGLLVAVCAEVTACDWGRCETGEGCP